ncbi:patatin-like phospholipase family protein [Sinimarinibacterium sp. NLF-5-8]|uniref:patatin-like phospholipase family protein n=1 Tax=Sinimarinibacterium sp. NLF-5-8 TaxID=2698684 RepID=UPI00137BB3CB|nr:patatin-like phospholipase family protein [Sinimarinibacterium sp. NLF-5-8]QHS11329.1 cyclic nucleotide-binding domain-containing protein [Sinimarinibacterium sp. NLF-5-8]
MNIATVLQQTPLFSTLEADALARLAALAHRQDLACGQRLYSQGDSADDFYMVASGRLRVSRLGRTLGHVDRLQPVGEMSVVTRQPRNADVDAVRDSVLIRIARPALMALLEQQAPTLLRLTQLIATRARQSQSLHSSHEHRRRGTFALIPAHAGVPVTHLAQTLVHGFGGWPRARLITAAHVDAALGTGTAQTAFDDARAHQRLTDWLGHLETLHELVIYAADPGDTHWSTRCLRRADRVLLLAEASVAPAPIPALTQVRTDATLAPIELVLLRSEGDPSPYTMQWRALARARAHYFVHPWEPQDLQALIRQTSARGVGLVLGGGGARGFAHIGLIRALDELQIPVDVSGGTSMGAFVAALLACRFDPVEMAQIARETFVNRNHLNDYTLPRVSLIRGRKFVARLREIFGARQIEDLPRSYYCMSTNLSTGQAMVHDHGELATWVATSMAVPGVAPPVAWRGQLLCDGGVVDNLPTDVMQGLDRGTIIACSVSAADDLHAPGAGLQKPDPEALLQWRSPRARPSFGEILMRTATLTADTLIQRESVARADIFIGMPVETVGMFDWGSLDRLIDLGYQHAIKTLSPLRSTLQDPASHDSPVLMSAAAASASKRPDNSASTAA